MRRSLTRTLLTSLFVFLLAASAAAQSDEDVQAVEAILEYSLVDNVLSGQAEAFMGAVASVVGSDAELDSVGLEQIVNEEFSSARMREDVVNTLIASSLPVVLGEVSELLSNGSIRQVSDLLADYEPPETLEEYVQALQVETPPQERIELIAGLADANQAAGFYLLLDETAREAAHDVASVVTDGDAPAFTELDEAVAQQQLQRGFQFAVVSFLHRYRPVGDELIAAATEEYRSSAGQWYVENYSLALAESIRLAALRVLERIG